MVTDGIQHQSLGSQCKLSRVLNPCCYVVCCRRPWQFKSSPRGRKSAKTAVDAAADGPPAFTAAPSAPPATVIAVASSDARQELPPPPQLQAPDRRTGPDPRNFPSMMDSHATRKKRSPPFARFPRSSRSR